MLVLADHSRRVADEDHFALPTKDARVNFALVDGAFNVWATSGKIMVDLLGIGNEGHYLGFFPR